jgi:predicted permease
MQDFELWNAGLWALVPTVLVSLLFWFIMRALFRADRTERKVYSRIEAEERAKRGLPPKA